MDPSDAGARIGRPGASSALFSFFFPPFLCVLPTMQEGVITGGNVTRGFRWWKKKMGEGVAGAELNEQSTQTQQST
jgi:hypothetical protein